jgi:hypothetical protein
MVDLIINDDDIQFGHLITYDEDHNDPPADLIKEAELWCDAQQVHYTTTDTGTAIHLAFPSQIVLNLFILKFERKPYARKLG